MASGFLSGRPAPVLGGGGLLIGLRGCQLLGRISPGLAEP